MSSCLPPIFAGIIQQILWNLFFKTCTQQIDEKANLDYFIWHYFFTPYLGIVSKLNIHFKKENNYSNLLSLAVQNNLPQISKAIPFFCIRQKESF